MEDGSELPDFISYEGDLFKYVVEPTTEDKVGVYKLILWCQIGSASASTAWSLILAE